MGFVSRDEQWRAANKAESRLKAEARSGSARISCGEIALMIEEFHPEIRINRSLIGVGGWPGDLVTAGAQEQSCLAGKAMIEPERSLIRSGDNFGGLREGARAVGAVGIVRQRITGEQRRDAAADGNGQRIPGKCGGVDALPLRGRRHREYLRGPENLPEAL